MGRVCVGGEHLFTSISLSPLGFLCGYIFHLSRFSLGLGTQSQMVHTVDSPGLPIIIFHPYCSPGPTPREGSRRQGQLRLSGPLGRGWWDQVLRAAAFTWTQRPAA